MPASHRLLAPCVGWRTTWAVGLLTFVGLMLAAAWRAYPPLPRALDLQITFAPGVAGRAEPIVAAGAYEAGDFLHVTYESETTARLSYDYWGVGGPSSELFTFEPGRSYAFHLEMPALVAVSAFPDRSRAPLLVVLDGRELLRAEVPFHPRDSTQFFFGENPIGGTTGRIAFRGQLVADNGRILRGGLRSYFSTSSRIAAWLTAYPWRWLALALCSAAIAIAAPWGVAWCVGRPSGGNALTNNPTPSHRWFAMTAALCVAVFAWVITGGDGRLVFPEVFGDFYDYQALSLLHGRLDVPEAALSGEAFVFGGKYYGYFGPTPALLRIPLVLTGVGFGHVSRIYMILDYVACLIAAYALLCHATTVVKGLGNWPSLWATTTFVGAIGLGSTLLFLGSRAYIYHEAILCGATFTLWSGYAALRFLAVPTSRWWIGSLVCGTLAVHARPPIGFFALSLLGCVAAIHLMQNAGGARGRSVVIGLLAVAGVASFNGLSYLKFRTIEGCPLRYNVSYNPKRLAKIDSRQFHWSNFRFSADSYLLKPTLELDRRFPYFYLGGLDSRDYPAAKMDLTEPATGLPYAMPVLSSLALIALAAAALPGSRTRLIVLVATVAAVPMTVAMFTAIAVSHRYTADFVGYLAIVSALGIALLDLGSQRWLVFVRTGVSAATLLGAAMTVSFSLYFQGEIVWGTSTATKERYEQLRARFAAWPVRR